MKQETTKNSNKTLKGKVVSDKMNQTRTVLVERFVKHPKYGKFLTQSKKYKAHDQENRTKIGDLVLIRETKPISKDKHFEIVYR